MFITPNAHSHTTKMYSLQVYKWYVVGNGLSPKKQENYHQADYSFWNEVLRLLHPYLPRYKSFYPTACALQFNTSCNYKSLHNETTQAGMLLLIKTLVWDSGLPSSLSGTFLELLRDCGQITREVLCYGMWVKEAPKSLARLALYLEKASC